MLVATLEQERKQIYQTGHVAGEVEGRRQTLFQFIHWRFRPTQTQEENLAQQLATVNNVQDLAALTEIFLKVATFDEFVNALVSYLPKPKGKPE